MEYSKCLWLLLLASALLGGCGYGCWEKEKAALLQLKPFFINNIVELENWVDVGSSNCCDWERVKCNPNTGRITQLFLNLTTTIYEDPYTDTKYAEVSYEWSWNDYWHLNSSLFLPFEELRSLYLNGNPITGYVDNQGFERLSKLDKLEIIDLSYNYFDHSIFSSLSKLSSLKYLNLASNRIVESNHTVNDIKMLAKLNKLEILDLSGNMLGSNILSHLGAFRSLKTLCLQSCGMKGFVAVMESRLMNLEVLDLSSNLFNNTILSFIGRFSNLKSFYLRDNKLKGTINIRVLASLRNLKEMYLSCSYVSKDACSFQLQSLGLFPSLKSLFLERFTLIGAEISQKWDDSSSLEELTLADSFLLSNFIQAIGTMGSLRSLTIINCDIFQNNLSTHSLHQWKSLESLHISDSYLETNFLHQIIRAIPSLKFVSLGTYRLHGNLHAQEFCALKHLQQLYVWDHYLKGDLPACFGNLTSLEILHLSSHQFSGNISVLKTLTSLKRLHLHLNQFSGDISALHNMISLKVLSLSSNKFSGNISSLKALTSLKRLYLHSNQFSGDISALSNLTSLERLDLSSNQFSGDISALKNLTSLERLDLSFNQFSGNLSALQRLTSLQVLSLSNNNFGIISSLRPLFNLSKLKEVSADNNAIYADSTELQLSTPRFQLYSISLSCCGVVGSFPLFLYHQHDLYSVDLSNTHFEADQFPGWLLRNNTNLYSLSLFNTSLSGPFQLPFASHLKLSDLDVSNNFISGVIPADIGAQLPSLYQLNVSKNYFSGSIPSSLCDISSLFFLDLSNNQLCGGIPEHLAMGCSSLQVLALSNNTLEGQIFLGKFNSTMLTDLRLDGNNFSGRISNLSPNCFALEKLDLSSNHLFGRIPSWIGNLSSLKQIAMANNHLEGPIPTELCKLNFMIEFLDLSENNIYGMLPSCFSPSETIEVHLSKNRLQGPFPNAFRYSSGLVTLDLSYNNFTGNVPNWIGELSELSYLLLKRNHFEGEIPIQLCKLAHLSLIDISLNNLSGGIPLCLKVTALNYVSDEYVDYFWINGKLPNSSSSSKNIEEPIEYTVKSLPYFYKRRNLMYMSGIDLSCNKLTGEIPRKLENSHMIFSLNLSHNSLTGPIPQQLSTLIQLESLDLSNNKLSGNIPHELVKLHFLAFFNVSYNNLSGKTPEMIAQFGTFDKSSYMGNHFLCGPPLQKNCSKHEPLVEVETKTYVGQEEDGGLIDMDAFYVTFFVAYVIVLLTIAFVLYINPYWRRVWFYHIEIGVTSCYYFVIDHLPF